MDSQKVVLITGSSSGFGRLTAQTLARKGYRVFASMRGTTGRNAKARIELQALAQKESLALEVLELDVTNDASVDRAVREVIDQAGRIDVLVNNAAFACLGMTEAFTLEQAQRIFDTNFFGAVRMNRAVLPHMLQRASGLLVHVSSGAGRVVLPGLALYCATKFALEALAEAYRYELARLGIDSVIVEPGSYQTPILTNTEQPRDPSRAAAYGPVAAIPQKVLEVLTASQADPQEVADAILHLIETPPGERPLRTLVGGGVQALRPLNDMAEQLQREVLEAFGLAQITSFASRTSTT